MLFVYLPYHFGSWSYNACHVGPKFRLMFHLDVVLVLFKNHVFNFIFLLFTRGPGFVSSSFSNFSLSCFFAVRDQIFVPIWLYCGYFASKTTPFVLSIYSYFHLHLLIHRTKTHLSIFEFSILPNFFGSLRNLIFLICTHMYLT